MPVLKKIFLSGSGGLESSVSSFQLDCKNAVGYLAVYRFCFIVTLFFCLFSGK